MREHGVQAQAWAPFAEGRNKLFQNEVLAGIAAKARQVDRPGGAALAGPARYRGLAKTVRRERMAENLDVFDFALDEPTWPPSPRWNSAPAASSRTAIRPSSNG
jgi:2,5-diketo-D-gluconate reductase A